MPMQDIFKKKQPTQTQTQLGRGGEYHVCCVSGVNIGEDGPLESKAQVWPGEVMDVLTMDIGLGSYYYYYYYLYYSCSSEFV
jgi:hypothetical protein